MVVRKKIIDLNFTKVIKKKINSALSMNVQENRIMSLINSRIFENGSKL